jgi:UTP--glucose-1-phosphate uridylyltransferase
MEKIDPFIEKMRREGLPESAIAVFADFYRRLAQSASAVIPESEIVPIKSEEIGDSSRLSRYVAKGNDALSKTAVIKLNGGMGTTMGLQGPKSLITVKNGRSFMDIAIMQIRHLNEHHGLVIPLVIMNSFFTDTATRKALINNGDRPADFIQCFNQHKFPKILEKTLEPVSSPSMPSLEWYPAGHGDLLLSLHTSGLLEQFIRTGYRYLFVSNIDNLGAEIDPCILGYFAGEGFDFLMEVTDRTEMDRKGGHLARSKTGTLVLREAAQCDRTDSVFFSDIVRHRFFNTNNLWINCASAQRMVREGKNADLPMVINRKKLVPHDPASPGVYHLESALGSAISLFEKSAAVRVPRSRFTPVKNCEDLLLVWSDYYLLNKGYRISADPARKSASIALTLDPEFYSSIDLLQSHFPYGAPSLVDCESFSVTGDVKFGGNIAIRGSVTITNMTSAQVMIEDNTTITENRSFQTH